MFLLEDGCLGSVSSAALGFGYGSSSRLERGWEDDLFDGLMRMICMESSLNCSDPGFSLKSLKSGLRAIIGMHHILVISHFTGESMDRLLWWNLKPSRLIG